MPIPDRGDVVGAGGSSQKSWQDSYRHPLVMENVTAFVTQVHCLGAMKGPGLLLGTEGCDRVLASQKKPNPPVTLSSIVVREQQGAKPGLFPTTVLYPLLPAVYFPSVRQGEATSGLQCVLASCF